MSEQQLEQEMPDEPGAIGDENLGIEGPAEPFPDDDAEAGTVEFHETEEEVDD